MFKDLKIYITGFKWDYTQNFSEVNFFNYDNDGEMTYDSFTERFDITNYILRDSISELNFTREKTEKTGKVLDNYILSGDISFNVTDIIPFETDIYGIEDTYFMHDFFQVYENTSLIKYLVEVFYKNKPAFIGFVNQDAISEALNLKPDSEIIPIHAIGMEKEFKDYYDNIKLSDKWLIRNLNAFWNNKSYGLVWTLENNGNWQAIQYMQLESMLSQLFKVVPDTTTTGGLRVEVDCSDIQTKLGANSKPWYVVKRTHISCPNVGDKGAWFHTGMDKILENTSETCFGFLRKLCNAMGWTFGIYLKDTAATTKAYLTIRNSYNVQSSNFTVTKDNMQVDPSVSINKSSDSQDAYFIIVPNGSFDIAYHLLDDGTDLQHNKLLGSRCYVATNSIESSYKTDVYDGFYKLPNNIAYQGIINTTRFSKEISNTETKYFFDYVAVYANQNPAVLNFQYNKEDFVILDTGSVAHKIRLDMHNGEHWDNDSDVVRTWDILWSGNYGGILGYDGNGDHDVWTYKDYTNGKTINYVLDTRFSNNLKTLLIKKSNLNPEVTVNEVLMNPLRSVTFNNIEEFANKTFAIQEMKVDFIKDTTTMKLIYIQ